MRGLIFMCLVWIQSGIELSMLLVKYMNRAQGIPAAHGYTHGIFDSEMTFKYFEIFDWKTSARQRVQYKHKLCIYCMCMFRAGFMSVYVHMCVCLHAWPLKSKHSSTEHTSGGHVCINIYIYIHLCIWSTSAKIRWKEQHTYYTLPTSLMLRSEFVLSHCLIFKA